MSSLPRRAGMSVCVWPRDLYNWVKLIIGMVFGWSASFRLMTPDEFWQKNRPGTVVHTNLGNFGVGQVPSGQFPMQLSRRKVPCQNQGTYG